MDNIANNDFICPVCGGRDREYEEGHLIVYSGVHSHYDEQIISMGICSKCADAAFETIQKEVSPARYKKGFYC